ncbi:farnesol dehydrogenase-like [Bradysia coprophila]|uniref:farnesol dehydrogenase-like n=1 Tax=Bradysia coprophila TaxID=38358 RepID=UPI00187D8850|nr:farnesol dehydrogenase-like [Bradysia coprophila]
MDKWKGKVAVVTGASSGIGAAVVKDLANMGVNVIGLARRHEMVEEISENLKNADGKVYARQCDISDMNSLKETFNWIGEQFSEIHILINNAGVSTYENILDPSDEMTRRINNVIDTNFTGLVHCTREAFKYMKDYGIIVNVASILDSIVPFPNPSSIYPAAKHAVRAFSEIIRQELVLNGNDKIRVSNLSPGLIKTNIGRAGGHKNPDGRYELMPYLQPEEVSNAVLYLLSTPYNVNISQITIKPVGERF